MQRNNTIHKRLSSAAALLLLGLCGTAPAQSQGIDTTPVGGAWNIEFCWRVGSCVVSSLDINQIGPFINFEMGDGSAGVGLALGTQVIMHFTGGCMPNYVAEDPTPIYMEGVMRCTDGSGTNGTWSALREVPQPGPPPQPVPAPAEGPTGAAPGEPAR